MKRLFLHFHDLRTLFFLSFSLCFSLSASADGYCDFTVNNIHYIFLPNTTNEVAVSYREYESGRYGGYYSSYTGSVTIPAAVVYNSVTYKVTTVGHGAFAECYSLTSVTLPNTITKIESYAFGDCGQLTSVNIPQTVNSIGASAFNGCIKLTSVNIPNGIAAIEANTFKDCQSLSYISLPSSITSIGSYAFSGCANLSSINFSNSQNITEVGDNAFYGTAWLNNQSGLLYIGKVAYKYCGTMPTGTNITLKDGTTRISKGAFSDCSGLASIDLPESLTTIGGSAFSGCTSLKEITIPRNMVSMGLGTSSSVFYGCSGLKKVTILCPNIGSWWFRDLSSLEEIVFGNSVESIGEHAFYFCKGLTSIVIPETVTTIGNEAFSMCTNLSSVTIGNSQAYISFSAFYGTPWMDNQPDGLIYIGQIAYKYKGTMSEGTHIDIREGTVAIAEKAFNYYDSLASVSIPNSVKTIGDYAFQGCVGLTSVTIPEGVTAIGNYVFSGCNRMKSVYLPESLTDIGTYAFHNCTSLESVEIPNGLTAICQSAFYGCNSLTSLTIPEGVVTIDSYAFNGCTKLSSVKLPHTLVNIGESCFKDCTSLTSFTIPENVKNIGITAFCNTSLTTLTVGMKEPIDIVSSVFSYYSNYYYVSFANNVTLYVPYGSKPAYETTPVWQDFKEIIEQEPEPTDISVLDDAIYAEASEGLKGGDGTLTICLKNAQATNAYSFDLILPEGVTLAKDGEGEYVYTLSNRHNGHSATVNYHETTGVYSFAVLSLSSKEVKGNDGTIWTLKLNVADNVAVGDYAVKVQNAKYSLTSGSTSVILPETVSVLTVEDYVKGDANGDGVVDIADAVCIVNHVVGKETPAFVANAADANGDGVVDIADAVRIVNLVVGKIDALARQLDPQ